MIKRCLIAALALSSPQSGAKAPLTVIEMVVNNQVIVPDTTHLQTILQQQGITFKRYNLDAPIALDQALSQDLPNTLDAAKNSLQQHLNQMGGVVLKQQYAAAYQGLVKSIAYQLDRLPAIIFNNGEAVIYGVTDLEVALLKYRQWQMTTP